jgi:hypothetical protein
VSRRKKTRIGRPPGSANKSSPDGIARAEVLTIRVSLGELAEIRRAARRTGLNVGALVRDTLRRAGVLPGPGRS